MAWKPAKAVPFFERRTGKLSYAQVNELAASMTTEDLATRAGVARGTMVQVLSKIRQANAALVEAEARKAKP